MRDKITKQKAVLLFQKNGGILRTRKAISLGINPKTLYTMRDGGIIEQVGRGLYRLICNTVYQSNFDLITISRRLPKGVVCLISALEFYGLTTQIPHYIYVAYQQGWRQPKLDYPPIKIFRYSKSSFDEGIEIHNFDGIEVKIYSAAKTVVDCFKFRNKVGLHIAVEALKNYWHKNKGGNISELLRYARVCRVEKIIKPYIETLIHE